MKYAILVSATIAIICSAFLYGRSVGKTEVQAAWNKQIAEQTAKNARVTNEVDTKQIAAQEQIRTVYKTIEKEVVKYVQANTDSCIIVDDGLRIFNSSVNVVPASQSND